MAQHCEFTGKNLLKKFLSKIAQKCYSPGEIIDYFLLKRTFRVSKQPKTVGFQLEDSYHRRLEKDGKEFKMSAGQYARQLVIDALDDTNRERLEKRMVMLETELSELRSDLAIAVEALLIVAGNYPKEKAREWVVRNLGAH